MEIDVRQPEAYASPHDDSMDAMAGRSGARPGMAPPMDDPFQTFAAPAR